MCLTFEPNLKLKGDLFSSPVVWGTTCRGRVVGEWRFVAVPSGASTIKLYAFLFYCQGKNSYFC